MRSKLCARRSSKRKSHYQDDEDKTLIIKHLKEGMLCVHPTKNKIDNAMNKSLEKKSIVLQTDGDKVTKAKSTR